MTSRQLDEEAIFHIARQLEEKASRSAYLDQVCAGDQALRERVEALLKVHEKEGDFLKSSPGCAPTVDPLAVSESPGHQIGRYKLLQKIGEGGFGVVFMADQQRPVRRKVALKIIKPGMDTHAVVARFEAERQALALMDHPNIARVFDGGETDSGRPYFVMELVRGVPITEYCDEKHSSPRERLELFTAVCQGVQHAHHKGIIHRDIKPSNVLVAEYDEQPVPKIIDFGVAKALHQRLSEKTLFTRLGQIIGTLEYMSPEQAKVNQLDVDTRTDVYSLGVLLYELLTGSTPFDKQRLQSVAWDELVRIIREEEPPRPSVRLSTTDTLPSIAAGRRTDPNKLRLLVRGELDWIVMKALDKERGRRYETAAGLADDTRRYLNDETVAACPPSSVYRLRKFARRNKAVLSVGLVIMMAILTGAVTTSWQAILAWKAERRALTNLNIAQQEREIAENAKQKSVTANARLRDALGELKRQNYFHVINLAYHAWNSGNRNRMGQLLDSVKPDEHAQSSRGFEWRYLAARQQELQAVPEIPTPDTVITVAFSPDGKYLVIGCIDGTVLVRDLKKGISIPVPRQLKGAYVAFSARGSYLAAGDGEHELRVWVFPEFQPIGQAGWDKIHIHSVAFSPDENLLAIGRTSGVIEIRSLLNGELVWQPRDSPQPEIYGMRLEFDPDGRYLAGAWKGVVTIWDVKSRAEIRTFEDPGGFGALAFSPNGKTLLVGGEFGVESWEVTENGLRGPSQPKGRFAATCASFSHDANLLAIGCANFRVSIVDPDGFEEIARLLQTDHVNCVAFSLDGKTVAAGGRENVVRVWNVDRWRSDVGREIAHDFSPPFAISSDGRIAIVREDEETGRHILEVWNPADGESTTVPEHADLEVSAVAFAPDKPVLAVATDNGAIRLWNIDRLAPIQEWKAHAGTGSQEFNVAGSRIMCLAFSSDGKTLVSGGDSPDLAVWDLSGSDKDETPPVQKLRDADGAVSSVAFSADGLLAAAGSRTHRRGETGIWCFNGGIAECVTTLQHPEWVRRVVFSPDGKRMALQHDFSAGVIRVYDVSSWQVLREYQGHASKSVSLAFAPDGRRLVTGSDDGTIRFWDIASNEPVGTLETHERIRRLAFLPDATTLVSASWDGWIRLWCASPKQ